MAEVRLSNRKHSARVKEWEEERAAAGPLVCGALDSVVDTVITEAVRALQLRIDSVDSGFAERGWLCGGPQEVARKLELGVLEGEVAGNRQAQQQLLRQQGQAEVTRRRRRRRRAADDDWGDSGSDGEGRSARGAGGKRQGGGSARGTAGRKAGRKGPGAQLRALQQQGQSLSHDLERLRRVDAIETESAVQDAVEWMIRWLEEERDAVSRDAERRAKEAEAARLREASERRAAELEARLAALEAEVRAQKEATASAAAVETALRRERLAEIIEQGDAAMEGGRWRAALGHYEAALEIDPEDEEALRKKKAALVAGEEEQGGSSAQGGKGRKGKQGRQSKGGRRRKGGAGGAGSGSGSGSESEYSEYEGTDGEVRTRQAERRDKDGKGPADGRGGEGGTGKQAAGQKAKKRSKAEVRSALACCCSVRAGCLHKLRLNLRELCWLLSVLDPFQRRAAASRHICGYRMGLHGPRLAAARAAPTASAAAAAAVAVPAAPA